MNPLTFHPTTTHHYPTLTNKKGLGKSPYEVKVLSIPTAVPIVRSYSCYGTTTISITTLSTLTFSIMTLSMEGLFVTLSIYRLSITMLCHYAECYNAESHVLFIVMLNVVKLIVLYPMEEYQP